MRDPREGEESLGSKVQWAMGGGTRFRDKRAHLMLSAATTTSAQPASTVPWYMQYLAAGCSGGTPVLA